MESYTTLAVGKGLSAGYTIWKFFATEIFNDKI